MSDGDGMVRKNFIGFIVIVRFVSKDSDKTFAWFSWSEVSEDLVETDCH